MRSRKYGLVTVENATPSMEFDRDEPCVVFRAQDAMLLLVLHAYRQSCVHAEVSADLIRQVDQTIDGVMLWQTQHVDRVKLPD